MKTKTLVGLIGIFFIANLALAHNVIDDILESYHDIQTALAKDLFDDARNAAKLLSKDAQHWLDDASATDPRRADIVKIHEGAKQILEAKPNDKQKMRDLFELVSTGVIGVIKADATLKSEWQLFYCPMVKKYWTQPKSDPKMMNPYMGAAMPQCGSKKPW